MADFYAKYPMSGGGGGGITQIGTIDTATKSANGAVISGVDLVMQTADGSSPGLMSTGTQTIAGAKTFSTSIQTPLIKANDGSTAIQLSDRWFLDGAGNVLAGFNSTVFDLFKGAYIWAQDMNANVRIRGPVTGTSSWVFDLPQVQAASASALVNNGSGVGSWLAYTNNNTVSTLVARDGSGDFAANSVTLAGVLKSADGAVGTPSVTFTNDLDSGMYRVGANDIGLSAGGFLGLEVAKSTGSFANVGMGSAPSASDNYPVLIQRSNASTGTYLQISNPSNSASAKATFQLATDVGANTGEVSVFTAATATDAYAGRMTVRASDSTVGLSLIAGDGATNTVRIYTGGDYTSTGNALEVTSQKAITLPQSLASGTATTPASGLTIMNDGGVLKTKNSSGTVATMFSLPSLTAGSVLFSDGTTIAQDNSNLFYDDTNNRLGIGTATPYSTLQVNGTVQTKVTSVSADTTLGDHYIVLVDDSGATRTMTLPAASANIVGRTYVIKKQSASNTTVIARAGSDTIDGATSYTLNSQYESITVVCTGATAWSLF